MAARSDHLDRDSESRSCASHCWRCGDRCDGRVLGLKKWRAETIGKRQIELAEDALAGFFEAVDVLEWVSSGYSSGDEGSTREAHAEDEDERRMKNSYFVPIERLMAKAEFFSALHAKKYRAMAYFGKDGRRPFEELHNVHSRIVVASRMLIGTALATGSSGSQQVGGRHLGGLRSR